MSTPTFSILHASYGRPVKAVMAIWSWFEHAANRDQIEYVIALNDDDPSLPQYIELLKCARPFGLPVKIVTGPFAGSAPAWDAAAKASSGLVLIQAQDDVEPPPAWDDRIMAKLYAATESLDPFGTPEFCYPWPTLPAFLAVSDGYRKDNLCCTAIMTRARYEQCGEFLHAGYRSVFSDDEVALRAYADAAAGKCSLIEARDLVFTHRHHYHDKTVPMDATYERENSAEAYAQGQALFMRRNAEILKFKTW